MIIIPVQVSSSGIPLIFGLMLCLSALGMLIFMWITMFQDRDKSIRIAASFMFLPLIIGLLLVICGGIMEMIST